MKEDGPTLEQLVRQAQDNVPDVREDIAFFADCEPAIAKDMLKTTLIDGRQKENNLFNARSQYANILANQKTKETSLKLQQAARNTLDAEEDYRSIEANYLLAKQLDTTRLEYTKRLKTTLAIAGIVIAFFPGAIIGKYIGDHTVGNGSRSANQQAGEVMFGLLGGIVGGATLELVGDSLLSPKEVRRRARIIASKANKSDLSSEQLQNPNHSRI